MTERITNSSATTGHARNKPSVSRRISIAVSTAEQGEAERQPARVQNQIEEEIDEIKRYEVGVARLSASFDTY